MDKYLSDVFKDTLALCDTNKTLLYSQLETSGSTFLYAEDFDYEIKPNKVKTKDYNITISDLRTFKAASLYKGKTAVLNFANPVTPGGGVWGGAKAQEESLCRCSTLYKSLDSVFARANYYEYNMSQEFVATDRMLYTPNIVVFKSDDTIYPELLPEDKWFKVDVITTAAHNFKFGVIPDDELYELMLRKIRKILLAAIGENVNNIILGAFGCGAFRNPPEVVARAFYELLVNQEYYKYFNNVHFAIAHRPENEVNLNAFKSVFEQKR